MYCMSCGSKMLNGAAFCASCGTPVGAVAPMGGRPAAPAYAGAASRSAVPYGAAWSQAAPGRAVPSYAGTSNGVAAVESFSSGCASAAWKDVTSTVGWAGTTALLGLLNAVPILSFFVSGYAMHWGADAARSGASAGKSAARSGGGMPQSIFTEGNFANGFYGFLENVVYGSAIALIVAVLATIPFLGMVAGCVFAIVGGMFVCLGSMRIAISGHLGPAFDVSNIWAMLKRKPGTLLNACVLPWVIGGAVTAALILLVAAGTCLAAFSLAGMPVTAFATAQGWMTALSLPAPLVVVTIAALAIVFLGAWGAAATEVVMYRALGIWVARNAPEWRSDPLLAAPEAAPVEADPDGYSIVPPPPGFHVGGIGDVYDGTSPVRPFTGNPEYRTAEAARILTHSSALKAAAWTSSHGFSGEAGVRPSRRDGAHAAGARGAGQREDYGKTITAASASSAATNSARFVYASSASASVHASIYDDGAETMVLESPEDDDFETFVYVAPRAPLSLIRANGERLDITSLPATLGKGSKADVMISGNPSISRLHARVRQSGDYYVVEDLNSTNKTYLNGMVVSPGKAYLLEDGAELRFGNEVMNVKLR